MFKIKLRPTADAPCECHIMGYAQSVSKLKNYINYLLTVICSTLSVKARSKT